MTMAKKKYIYMEVTKDQMSLPVAVADSISELAKLTGKTYRQINHNILKHEHGVVNTPHFIRVYIQEDE